jgi:kynurenine formamidase
MNVRELTRDVAHSYFEQLSNWGRWGPDDELGTLNLISGAGWRAQRDPLITEWQSITLARSISMKRYTGKRNAGVMHFMTAAGSDAPATGRGVAADWIGMPVHGLDFTHLDSPAHEFWNGRMYNDRPASMVRADRGAMFAAVDGAAGLITTRGVLLDVPRYRSTERLAESEAIFTDELEAIAASTGVEICSGDALLVRTGRDAAGGGPTAMAPSINAGLHASCLPWLHEQGIALLGGDCTNDVRPSGVDGLDSPIHLVGLVAMGLWLLDSAYLEDLADACGRLRRWTFALVCNPLPIRNGTGAPVAPVAIL